ncbi:hypothetical protein PORY_000352 [Pneumocystis oryctolagi]|uniref:Uncharacterized protein n=1 Tax=Pneumocystis oryctolagi TaxID=42067 RepID=A0ACB7CJG6_9ASCO|nr:hypothetical protein PORY_000352 [Pneumocystis oryctolagi]
MVLVACCQFCATRSILKNLEICKELMNQAVSRGAQVCFFPEASDFIGLDHNDSLTLTLSEEREIFINEFKKHVKLLKIHASIGLHEPVVSGTRIANVCVWIDDEGNITHRYQKLHLFRTNMTGGRDFLVFVLSVNKIADQMKESKYVEKGKDIIPPFETPIGKVGLAICHDIRYPEMSIRLRSLGADVITYPSAFVPKKYILNFLSWSILICARAIETQETANQVGKHNESRESYGHSMIADPWGSILASCSNVSKGPTFCIADIDLSIVRKVRKELPLIRRTDIYPKI